MGMPLRRDVHMAKETHGQAGTEAAQGGSGSQWSLQEGLESYHPRAYTCAQVCTRVCFAYPTYECQIPGETTMLGSPPHIPMGWQHATHLCPP